MGDLPELRATHPWVMEEMVDVEPGLAEPITALPTLDAVAEQVRDACFQRAPVVVTGCGTSEHASMAVTALLRDALPGARVSSRQAFEAALAPDIEALVIGVSHEGETAATMSAMRTARRTGAPTALLTAAPGSPAADLADAAVVTPLIDRSWCHTVGYVSPILAGAAVAERAAGRSLDGAAVGGRMARVLEGVKASGAHTDVGRALADAADRYVIVGSGLDRIGARELALKIEEGARRPAVGRDLETQLHGHMVSADERTGLIAFIVDPLEREHRLARTVQLLRSARRLGMTTAAIIAAELDEDLPADLTSAGRVVLPALDETSARVPAALLALTDAALGLQLLTIGLVHAVGTNPDRIGREDDEQREAADLADPGPEI